MRRTVNPKRARPEVWMTTANAGNCASNVATAMTTVSATPGRWRSVKAITHARRAGRGAAVFWVAMVHVR
jgi:hypothetical protein